MRGKHNKLRHACGLYDPRAVHQIVSITNCPDGQGPTKEIKAKPTKSNETEEKRHLSTEKYREHYKKLAKTVKTYKNL